jgi:galactose mutarotase-like enzyme
MIATLENAQIKLTIRPDLGGRIDQLQDHKTGREWLWHTSDYDPSQSRTLAIGASFDDHWTGGWDEIFPNDVAGEFQGRQLVDHGELWSSAWEVIANSSFSITMTRDCQTVPVRIEKTIRLDTAQPQAQIEYLFQNQSNETIPFLFKQHAAIAIEAGDEILLPDCLIEPVELGFSKIIGRSGQTRFPKALAADGQEIQVQRIPPASSQLQEFYYSSNLAVGECGIRNQRSQSTLLFRFDTADFPYVWVFQSYGGWREHYVLVLEPCTTIPYDLAVACRNGTAAQLKPQETQRRTLTVCLQ